jgi:fatty acid desaturase
MPLLCKYRHVFGKEREGVHAVRLLDVAVVDMLGTVLIAWLLSRATGWNGWGVFAALMLASLLLHRLFCVDTTLTKLFSGLP